MSDKATPVSRMGQSWAGRRVTLFHGQRDTRIAIGEDYETMALGEIFAMPPGTVDKGNSPACIPSTYHDFDARNHAKQRERGVYVMLCADIDSGDHPLERIETLVRDLVGEHAFLIYSSAHARPGDMRWRVLIPIKTPCDFETWHDAQNALSNYLETLGGIEVDRAMDRAAQPVFLPNVPKVHAKTGDDLRDAWSDEPLHYQRATTGTRTPAMPLEAGKIAQGIDAIRRKREEDEKERVRIRREIEAKRASRPINEGASVMADFNAGTSIVNLLELYGYQQSPRNPDDWRSPHQTGDSYGTRIIGDKWVSLSMSDAAAQLGDTCATGCYGDACDLFVHYEHGGDHKAAYRALYAERRASQPQTWSAPPPPDPDDPGPGEDILDGPSDPIEVAEASADEAISNAKPVKSEMPRPLYRELPPAEPFPVDALGETLGKAAKAIEAVIQCPMACAANSVLAVASLAAQGRANVILPIGQGKSVPLSLYLFTVLDSGERKSSADSMALKPVRDAEREIADMENAARQSYAVKLSAHEASTRHLTTRLKGDRAALEAALHDLGPPPQPPLLSVLAPSGDQTMEGLFRIYQLGRPSLAMLCDDAATFLGGHSLKAEQKAGTTANLCRAWDGSKLERIRGGDGVTVLYDRRLSCHLMVQPGVAAGFLSDSQFADQGLLARFLVSAPQGRAGTRIRDDEAYQALAYSAALDLGDYNTVIANLLRQPVRWKDEIDRALGVELDALAFTREARALYVDFANALEGELGPRASLAMAKAFASKLPENAARIAGTLALIADPQASQIAAATLADAIILAKYYLGEAIRLLASGAIDPELRLAETLLEWLHARPGKRIGLTTIYQRGPNSIRQADKASRAMEILAEHGWVKPIPDGAEIDGHRHKKAWEIVPC